MKRFLKLLAVVLCLSMFTPGVVPNAGIESVQAAQKVKLNYTKKTIYEGDSFTLKVSGTKKKVKWSSSNKKVATVSSKGVVKGKNGGSDRKTCKITAEVGSKKYVCKVTVKAVPDEDDEEDEADQDDVKEVGSESTDNGEGSSTSDSSPSDRVADNIAALKKEIQKYGYTNANGDKVIRGLEGKFTPYLVYEEKTDVLYFTLVGDNTTFDMELSSADNSLPIDTSFLFIGTNFAFIAQGTIIPSEYMVGQNCYFRLTENNLFVSEGDIQETSNAMLKLAFVAWNHMLSTQTSFTMKDIGFNEVRL